MDNFALLIFCLHHPSAPPNTLAPNNSQYFIHNTTMVLQTITFMFLGWYANVRIGWGNFKIPEVLQV